MFVISVGVSDSRVLGVFVINKVGKIVIVLLGEMLGVIVVGIDVKVGEVVLVGL